MVVVVVDVVVALVVADVIAPATATALCSYRVIWGGLALPLNRSQL